LHQQPAKTKKVVLNAPQEDSVAEAAPQQTKKVVRMADNHTFEAPLGATFEDPCLKTYGQLMDLMKKLNQEVAVHVSYRSLNCGVVFNIV
jgi:hypothetical protein